MTLVLIGVGHFHAHGTFARHGREDVDALGLERGGDVVAQSAAIFSSFTPGAGCNS